jgi:hypothetical protein
MRSSASLPDEDDDERKEGVPNRETDDEIVLPSSS